MKIFVAIGSSALFIVGACFLLFGEQISVRLLGAASLGILLFGVLGAFLFTGLLRTNGQQILRTQNKAAYWTNIGLYTIFATTMVIGMIMAACGYIPIQAPSH